MIQELYGFNIDVLFTFFGIPRDVLSDFNLKEKKLVIVERKFVSLNRHLLNN